MPTTLMRIYVTLNDAHHARTHLVDSGFPSERLQITSLQDEAGAVKGNFAVGNADLKGGVFRGSTIAIDDKDYERDFASVLYGGIILLTVDVDDPDQEAWASARLDEAGNSSTLH